MPTENTLVDLLEFLRNQYDFIWLTFHDYKCNQFKRSLKRSPGQIRANVFNEPHIQVVNNFNFHKFQSTSWYKIMVNIFNLFKIENVHHNFVPPDSL